MIFWGCLELFHVALSWLVFPVRWTPWGRQRVAFEKWQDETLFQGDWAFEVSSEGEWEQVRPWVDELLGQGKKIEVIFSSASVRQRLHELQKIFPTQLRLMPLPLLTPSWGEVERFVSSPRLVMCRYDFFPALMRLAGQRKSGLVWGSFKNRRQRFALGFWHVWYRFFFSAFTWVLPAVPQDEVLFRRIHPQVLPAADLRVPQILRRLERVSETLSTLIPCWNEFQQRIQSVPRSQRWVVGSFWEQDLAFLDDARVSEQICQGELVVLMVPHQLSPEWERVLRQKNVPVHHLHADTKALPQGPGIWLINLKGVLCELYTLADNAYVGGGFNRSVHSVLEPFVAGANVSCGPRTHRSTEVELVQSVGAVYCRVMEVPRLNPVDQLPPPQARTAWLNSQREVGAKLLSQVEKISC